MPVSAHKGATSQQPALSTGQKLGLYVHWPFCLFKCPYCDFNSHVRETIDQQAFLDAYLRELDHYHALLPDQKLTSIFFGGGTPSLMEAGLVGAVIEAIKARWPHEADLEITLEANPSSVEADKFNAFRGVGVNRVSIGVQSFDDQALKALGRLHGVDEALRAIDLAATIFDRYSFDLIYARPGQSLGDWQAELSRALSLAGGHLSLYQLTIEPGTAYQGLYDRGKLILPDEDVAAEMFELTQHMCAGAGLPAYEISNHAAPGEECRHNLIYWQGDSYIGIGPGAHGRIETAHGMMATANHKKPERWLKHITEAGHGAETSDLITPEDRQEERILMGLRLRDGIDKAHFQSLSGRPLEDVVYAEALADLVADGFVENGTSHLRLTAKGWPVLNAILEKLLA